MRRTVWVLASVTALLAAACSRTGAPVAAGESPEQTFELMRGYEMSSDYDAYVACMTHRGSGWMIAQLANGLLWDAGAQPIDPSAGAGSEKILERYGLDDLPVWFPEWAAKDGFDGAFVRLSKRLGSRRAAFLRDCWANQAEMLWWFAIVESPEERGDTRALVVANPHDPEASMTFEFVQRDGRWLFDGAPTN